MSGPESAMPPPAVPPHGVPRSPAPPPRPAPPLPTGPTAPTPPPVGAVTPEIELGGAVPLARPIPGTPRASFDKLPTGQVGVAPSWEQPLSVVRDSADLPEWMRPPPPEPVHRGLAGWALAFSVAGLAVSLFVGWGFPVALVGIITAAFALRRPVESRAIAGWALALGIVSVIYSLGWLAWAATRINLLG